MNENKTQHAKTYGIQLKKAVLKVKFIIVNTYVKKEDLK